jgi:drug/metabolite transporter (DMT)-like permease
MLWQNGRKATVALFLVMGWPGVGVAACFAMASTCFVVALAYTTVANVLLLQAGVPLIAALMAFVFFRERVPRATWIAIAAVISGVAVMVSESFGGNVSPIGDGLALMVALAFATATVVTRRHAHVAMMPAVCLGTVIAACVSATQVGGFAVGVTDGALLFGFGALNLGLGLAMFVTGVRRLPAAVAALIGIAEPVLGPLWVWLIHHEIPSQRTILGGAVVFVALVAHIVWQLRQPRPETPTATI